MLVVLTLTVLTKVQRKLNCTFQCKSVYFVSLCLHWGSYLALLSIKHTDTTALRFKEQVNYLCIPRVAMLAVCLFGWQCWSDIHLVVWHSRRPQMKMKTPCISFVYCATTTKKVNFNALWWWTSQTNRHSDKCKSHWAVTPEVMWILRQIVSQNTSLKSTLIDSLSCVCLLKGHYLACYNNNLPVVPFTSCRFIAWDHCLVCISVTCN